MDAAAGKVSKANNKEANKAVLNTFMINSFDSTNEAKGSYKAILTIDHMKKANNKPRIFSKNNLQKSKP